MVWDDQAIRDLRILWTQGHSTAEIGRRLGCSKNSVVGKAHRLDLDDRPSPIKREPGSTGPKPYVPRPTETLPPLPSYEPPPVVAAPVLVQPRVVAQPAPLVAQPVQFPTRSSGRCFFPMWRNGERPKFREDGSALLCGDPIERGSYCATHAEDCYSGHQWKSEAAA